MSTTLKIVTHVHSVKLKHDKAYLAIESAITLVDLGIDLNMITLN